MLNISNNRINTDDEFTGLNLQGSPLLSSPTQLRFRRFLLAILVVFLIFMFLPWTQNVQADGSITTLRPEQRPQTVHSGIAGRIEKWYVTEGMAVKKGDTIVFLSEIKTDYFDPKLVDRTGAQVKAKEGAVDSYIGKMESLESQIDAMRLELESKIRQIRNKIEQAKLKIESDSLKVVQSEVDLNVAQRQFGGIKALYDKGLKSLTELEEKRLKLQETQTKLVAAKNALESSRNDRQIYQTELTLTRNEYANKIAKTESERFAAASDRYDAEAAVNKLQIDRDNYSRRTAFYAVTAPQDGFIVKAMQSGIGEVIKEGDPIATVQPAEYTLAVEMYVRPMDLPLLQAGHLVRFTFDGWPSFFFSGWPDVSLGTFAGRIQAIDRHISPNKKFRVLVSPDPSAEPWPTALQPGGGARGIALLHDVPLWWEFWRVLNGFPPDRYDTAAEQTGKGK